jgi:hypothetical protein
MNLAELRAYADRHTTRSAFRLETLDRYTVDSDEGNLERYLAGERGPSWAEGGDWMDHLAQEEASGIRRYRVHVITGPLSGYLRYECEWGYAYTSKAGEEVFILDTAEIPRPDGIVDEDFWLYDDTHVVRMRYDPAGRFLTAEALPESEAPRYRRRRDTALNAAVPFEDYWQRHPEYWRANWRQAR